MKNFVDESLSILWNQIGEKQEEEWSSSLTMSASEYVTRPVEDKFRLVEDTLECCIWWLAPSGLHDY